jgi:ATP-dependent Clp protease ATP-binding subunit ClpB
MGITMNPEKLTSKFKSALNDAQSLALAKDHQFIEGMHLLSAMLEQQGGSTVIAFNCQLLSQV